jgi:hypothetical protein
VNCPGTEMVIRPPYAHWQVERFVRAGRPPAWTVGDPGVHGAGMTGVQGIGVSTPSAAAVAVATAGLARLVHTAKGPMLTKGTVSVTVATGVDPATVPAGRTFRVPGAAPKLHNVIAPLVTTTATTRLYLEPDCPGRRALGYAVARKCRRRAERAGGVPEVLSHRHFPGLPGAACLRSALEPR